MDKRSVDVLIVGGGLVGMALLLALKHSNLQVLLVEAQPPSPFHPAEFDARNIALSSVSVRILQQLQVWPLVHPEACPIQAIHVSERYGFGSTHLTQDTHEPLGYVVEMHSMNQALQQCVRPEAMLAPGKLVALNPQTGEATLELPGGQLSIKAQLIVAADGTDSTARSLCGLCAKTKPYPHHAMAANIGLSRAHRNIAYEQFTPTGPLAFLPMNHLKASMIWSLTPEDAAAMLQLSDKALLHTLQKTFGYRLGRFTHIGRRFTFPLQQVIMPQQMCHRVVFVGNTAHTLHPIAAQGFNLGLRDVAMLAQSIIHDGLTASVLADYQNARRYDQYCTTQFTNGLMHLFTSTFPGVSVARRAGLVFLEHSPVLKRALMRFARGFIGVSPDLACGIALTGKDR